MIFGVFESGKLRLRCLKGILKLALLTILQRKNHALFFCVCVIEALRLHYEKNQKVTHRTITEEYILEDLNEEELGEQDVSRRLSIQVLAQNLEDKTQILQMLLHCADLANPTKDFKTYKMWTDKVMEEFWNQGDLEKKLGLSVQAMFDKEKADVVSTEFSKIY